MNTEPGLADKIFTHRGLKFLLFLASYVLMVLLLSFGDMDIFLVALLYFPEGLAWFFKNTELKYANWIIIGFSIYLVITAIAVAIKNIRIAKVLYIIFVALLILNFIGCVQGMPHEL
jgi:hypothetical protein